MPDRAEISVAPLADSRTVPATAGDRVRQPAVARVARRYCARPRFRPARSQYPVRRTAVFTERRRFGCAADACRAADRTGVDVARTDRESRSLATGIRYGPRCHARASARRHASAAGPRGWLFRV